VAWRSHRDVLGNAITLASTTGVTSGLGFVYWAVAARLFSQQAVGYGSAAVSAMMLIGTTGMLGMGTVLIGELPRRKDCGGLVSAALIASAGGSLLLGFAFVILAPSISRSFYFISGTIGQQALFVAGVVVTGVSLTFDQATIGLLRGGIQLSRNIVFSIVKLLMLPCAAAVIGDRLGIGVLAAWVIGISVSLAWSAIRLWGSSIDIFPSPDWALLRGLSRTALAHNWLNLSVTIPQAIIPVLVTLVVSPAANAVFYASWTISGFMKILPVHLSIVLFAVIVADPQVMARKLRFTLRLSLLIGLPGLALLGIGAHLLLGLFGARYARAGTVALWLLLVGYLPCIPKVHYMAVCRASGHIARAAAVLSIAAGMEIAATVLGGMSGGVRGVSLALLIVYTFEGLVTLPAVLRAAAGRTKIPVDGACLETG
jgi:O-antigen/teichoic acid export membrane protein